MRAPAPLQKKNYPYFNHVALKTPLQTFFKAGFSPEFCLFAKVCPFST
jgi:hypothetical protein